MRKTYEQKRKEFYDQAFDELFRRAGFEGYDEEFAQKTYWFTERQWTLEEDVNFTKWFMEEYRKTFRCSKHIAKWAAGMFILNYGWKVKQSYQLK